MIEAAATDALLADEQLDDVFYRGVLIDITGAARDFAQLLLDATRRARDPADVVRLTAAFERVSRSARRGILLAKHIRKPLKSATSDRTQKTPEAREPNPPKPPSDAVPETGTEAQQRQLLDRLDTLDTELAITFPNNQIPAAIATLRRDLQHVFEELSKPLYKPQDTPHNPLQKPSPPGRGLGEGNPQDSTPSPRAPDKPSPPGRGLGEGNPQAPSSSESGRSPPTHSALKPPEDPNR